MADQRTTKPSPLAGEGAERQAAERAQPVRPRREAGEGFHTTAGAFEKHPSPGRSPSGGASRQPAVSRPPSPARGEGVESAEPSVRSIRTKRARALRGRMTDAELKLWFALRDRRFANFKFRRQVPIGPFIADFACCDLRIVIEVDGGQHAESRSDRRRDEWFARNDFLVLRIWNNDVLLNLDGVLTSLLDALEKRSRAPNFWAGRPARRAAIQRVP